MLSVDWDEQSAPPTRTQIGVAPGPRAASSPEPSPMPGIENFHISANIIAQK